ncbi:hypothetical protein A3F00_04745 [Candidatus Daviesbacteria bacterium RIFCSPHIGHO2_12_FULL_37_11]|uniref:SbsA Ig-like domain-containing protein n=1 Tax=Candidatus Daviesbacteria bacterium RIFCSPHIGHO2_12_FULL_37_11 TaxID=1797777 RepID=A0A1F5KAV8_9BACT|nr:MAG: hypothetical protein A2769_01640 [Candidatus Daviesbacteria bacterium RIFCSPHIGHO2_01_FULL_37_27]OGE38077.1 MAG: hypothetical protein A3F00_04745 [Candidatus Daviesbacteria bacterium RIFCSPHIGHO2_12_FULL_37_11]OGE44931.1 MAG: hypothetical protein A3B39_02435 [Candidatus Daviesbacteria bacterium RIFCSPLOWO2_01_FULL_37_10]
MKKQIILGIVIVLSLAVLIFVSSLFKIGTSTKQETETIQVNDELEIISTNPDPLEGAVVMPSQIIEIKFNKIISVSEFKHKFDPELEHEVIPEDEKLGTTFKIKFKKPLDLGSGYTLYILPDTNGVDKKILGKDVIYHFSTIKYKGV